MNIVIPDIGNIYSVDTSMISQYQPHYPYISHTISISSTLSHISAPIPINLKKNCFFFYKLNNCLKIKTLIIFN